MPKIGIVGMGVIGRRVAEAVHRGIPGVTLAGVTVRKPETAAGFGALPLDALIERSDLIVEAATQAALREFGPTVLGAGKHLMVLSVGALVGVLDWKLDIQGAIDLPNFGSRNGPTEIEAGSAYEALIPELERRGHEVEIFAHSSAQTPLRLVESVEPRRYDVIHDHTGSVSPGRLAGPHLVRTLHFCVAAKMATYVRLGRLRTLANPNNWHAVRIERERAQSAAALIAVSARVRREFGRFHGLDPARATVISNGASFAAPAEPRERPGGHRRRRTLRVALGHHCPFTSSV